MRNWRRPILSIFFWIAAAVWCGVLFFFSGQDAAESSALSYRITEFVLRVLPFLPYSVDAMNLILRDVAHFGIFAVEGFLLGCAMMTTLSRRALGGLLAAFACGAMAVLNEYHQTFADGRACEVKDMLVDSGGALTGVLFAALILSLGFHIAGRLSRASKC